MEMETFQCFRLCRDAHKPYVHYLVFFLTYTDIIFKWTCDLQKGWNVIYVSHILQKVNDFLDWMHVVLGKESRDL
jgi:hypothetical protein